MGKWNGADIRVVEWKRGSSLSLSLFPLLSSFLLSSPRLSYSKLRAIPIMRVATELSGVLLKVATRIDCLRDRRKKNVGRGILTPDRSDESGDRERNEIFPATRRQKPNPPKRTKVSQECRKKGREEERRKRKRKNRQWMLTSLILAKIRKNQEK